jgi:hypothetical protein
MKSESIAFTFSKAILGKIFGLSAKRIDTPF